MFRDRRKLALIITVLVLFALISLPFSFTRPIRRTFTGAMVPAMKLTQGIYHRIALIFAVIFTSDNPYNRAQKAQETVKEAEADMVMLKEETQRLRSLNDQLGEVESTNYTLTTSIIIGREPTRWYNTALLDKGSRSGVAGGQAVVSGKDFVGRIVNVGSRWSRVRFIIDPGSNIPGQFKDSVYFGLVTGISVNRLKMGLIDKEAPITPGDPVVTACFTDPDAGIKSILPPGFVIGEIVSVTLDKDELCQTAYIKPAVDFKKLKTVLIIKTE